MNWKKFMKKKNWKLVLFIQFLAIPNNTFTILTNTKLYLPNKSGINWYCLVSTKHQESQQMWFHYHEGIITLQFWQFFVCLISSRCLFWWFTQNLWCLFKGRILRSSFILSVELYRSIYVYSWVCPCNDRRKFFL